MPLAKAAVSRLLTAHRIHYRSVLALGAESYMGLKRDEDLRAGLRSFPVGEYVILYRIQGEDIFILHVMHGSRNMPSLL